MLDFLLVFVGLVVVSGVIYGLATFVFGRGEELAPVPAEVAPMLLPDHRALTATDVRDVRLPVTVRGYRMADVDELLDRIAEELDRRGRPPLRLDRPPALPVTAHPPTGTGLTETGPVKTGLTETRPAETGSREAGPTEAGPTVTGPIDAVPAAMGDEQGTPRSRHAAPEGADAWRRPAANESD